VIERVKDRVVAGATGMFKHAGYPLTDTLSHRGDPGLFGPESITWPVLGDVAAFIGGIRALLIQAAHPEVAAGVADHSRYREDPLGRLSRTSNYVTATCFGALPEVERAVAVVRRIHRRVAGTSHRGVEYAADLPDMAAWVHNALTSGFLVAHQRFGPGPTSPPDADRFVAEQTRVGALLDADPMPATADALSAWLEHHAGAGRSPAMEEAIGFLRKPPLPFTIRIGYRVMFAAAAATIPPRLRRVLGLRRIPGAILAGRAVTRFLRWALGSSPSWHLALIRVGAPVPDGLFRQPLPPEAVGAG
jgi:uncharacterized protein (DUF2236 family)